MEGTPTTEQTEGERILREARELLLSVPAEQQRDARFCRALAAFGDLYLNTPKREEVKAA